MSSIQPFACKWSALLVAWLRSTINSLQVEPVPLRIWSVAEFKTLQWKLFDRSSVEVNFKLIWTFFFKYEELWKILKILTIFHIFINFRFHCIFKWLFKWTIKPQEAEKKLFSYPRRPFSMPKNLKLALVCAWKSLCNPLFFSSDIFDAFEKRRTHSNAFYLLIIYGINWWQYCFCLIVKSKADWLSARQTWTS